MRIRKHEANKSAAHTLEDEIAIKTLHLQTLISDDALVNKISKSPSIVGEFITITGREIKS